MKARLIVLFSILIPSLLWGQTPNNCGNTVSIGSVANTGFTDPNPACGANVPGIASGPAYWTGTACNGFITTSVVGPPVNCLVVSYGAVNTDDYGTISTDTGGNLTLTGVNMAVNGNVIGPYNCGSGFYGNVMLTVCSDIPFSSVTLTNTGCTSGWVVNCADQGTCLTSNCTTPCLITNLTASIGACVSGAYQTTGQVEFTNPPTTGQLIIEDCNGNQDVYNAPFTSPQNYTITGQNPDGGPCDVTAYFTDDLACTQTINYTAPTCPCNIDNFNVSIGNCDQITNNYCMTGDIQFTNPPAGGTLIVEVDNGTTTYDTIINPPFVSGQTFSICGIPSDGSASTITVYFSADPGCSSTINYTAPTSCACLADLGTFTATITGGSTNNYVLCYGDQISITSNGDWTGPGEQFNPPGPVYNPGISWLIYSCPPTVGTVPQAGVNITTDTCFLGLVSDFDLNDVNDQFWLNFFPPGTFTNNTIYWVPITMYDLVGNTYSYVNGSIPCYELGAPFAVQYLPEFSFTFTENCLTGEAIVTVNGGMPAIDGSLFTASNLSPGTSSFANTTASDGGTITVTGLQGGDMWSFDVVDANGCPYTVSGGPFPPLEDPGFSYPQSAYCSTDGPSNPSITGVGGGTFTVAPAGLTLNASTGQINPSTSTIGSYDITYTTPGACFDDSTVTIVINDPPVAGLDATLTWCDNYPVTALNTYLVGADPGGTWTVSAGAPGANFDPVSSNLDPNGLDGTYSFDYTVTGIVPCPNDVATITITIDGAPPIINCPGNLTAVCSITEQPPYVDFAAFAGAGGSASDPGGLIDPASFALQSETSDGNTCPEVVTRVYEIADTCGHVSTCTQTITINDVIAPTGTAPANVNIECITDVPAADPALIVDEADNCGIQSVVHLSDVSDGQSCPETIVRTYRITDLCGNITDVTQNIIINDVTPPTASNPAQTIVPGGPAPAPDPAVVIDEADNCGTPIVAFVSQVTDNNPCPETITYTYSVTDSCGNSINVTHDVLITDPIAPTGTAPADITVDCITAVPAADPALITDEADNNGVPTVTHLSDVSDGNSCPEIITRTYRITDPCGNFIDVVQLITVHDQTPPTATAPAPVSVQCSADVPPVNIADVTGVSDNCGTPTVTHIGDVSDNNTCPETITRTYAITDSCGNQITVDQIITVDDTTNPVATAPVNVNIECITDLPAINIADVTGVSDNCTVNPVVAHVSDVSDGQSCPETITRTYSITDDCGNSITVSQDIIINDVTPPTASNPATTTIPGGPAPAPDPAVVIDEADNCGTPTVAFVSQVSNNQPCPETITYTYSVTDSCGNSINVTHDVIITDPILPTATAPADINVECITDVPAPDPLLITDEADNNGVPTVTWASDVSDGNSCPETITRTYDVTDACGNVIQVSHNIIVNDVTPPTASNPAPINVECIGDVPAADPLVVTDEADNCGTPTVAFVSDVSDNGTCPETITRTYSVTDSCGNSINVTQQIIVNDITPPVATAPANVNIECITDVPAINIADVTGVSDNCTMNPVVAHVSDVSDGQSCPETITRTYSITDDCGNQITVSHDIIINDVTPPTASNPATTTIPGGPAPAPDPAVVIDEADNCGTPTVAFVSQVSDNQPCPETITYTYSVTDSCGNSISVTHDVIITDPILPTGTAPVDITVECIGDVPLADPALITDEADNNGVPTVAFVSDVSDNGSCPEIITRTYSITDICGNQILVTQQITVIDTTDPTASNPAPVSVQCSADVPAPDPLVVIDEADNCTTNPIVAFVSDASDGNACPETITRTYSITDDCGNQITVTQTILVDDTIDPTASNPAQINVECITDVPLPDPLVVIDEADNCTVNPSVAWVSDVSDGNSCPEIITRTYSVTDDCGNSINVTQIIKVEDITDPTASTPAPITVACASDVPAVDPTVVIDETDNCGTPTVAFVSEAITGSSCNNEVRTRTYSITDSCGNSITVDHVITIDAANPTVDAGMDQSICEGTSVTLNATSSAGSTFVWDQGVQNGVPFQPTTVGTNTYTVTAEICSGQCTASDIVNVEVNPLPVIDFYGDVLIGCEPHTVNFTNLSSEQYDCTWDFAGVNVAGCGPVSYTFASPGFYDVGLTVTSAAGCTSSDIKPSYIEVIPMPEASFNSSETLLTIEDTEVEFTNTSINATTYYWNFGDNTSSTEFEPTHYFPNIEEGVYTVVLYAYNELGCVDSAFEVIRVEDVLIFYVPNVFTPDGDMFNEDFTPIFTSGFDPYDYHLTIFNRWGEIIFESYNHLVGWNGHYGDGGLVEDGVYVWQIEFGETGTDKKQTHRGHVTVLK